MQPFSGSESSMAMRTVTVASGSIGQYCPSWCQGTAMPWPAGLQKSWLPQRMMSGPISCSTMSTISPKRQNSSQAQLPTIFADWPQGLCAPESISGRTSGWRATRSSTSFCMRLSRSSGTR